MINSGRVMDVNDTMACPGAKDGSCFHKPSLMPPIDFRSLPTTAESPILWIILEIVRKSMKIRPFGARDAKKTLCARIG